MLCNIVSWVYMKEECCGALYQIKNREEDKWMHVNINELAS